MNTVCDPIAGSGELALRKHGMDGQRLLNMAYAVANAYARRTGSGLDSRLDDLAQHLAVTAIRRALNYDTAKNPNSTFASYLWDIMEPACIDWHRKKAEGFGDRRYGHDNRLMLTGDFMDDLHDDEDPYDPTPVTDVDPAPVWVKASQISTEVFTQWPKVTERRLIRWTRIAEQEGLALEEFIVHAADVYASAMEKRAA